MMEISPRRTRRPLFKTKNVDSPLTIYIVHDEIFSSQLGLFFI